MDKFISLFRSQPYEEPSLDTSSTHHNPSLKDSSELSLDVLASIFFRIFKSIEDAQYKIKANIKHSFMTLRLVCKSWNTVTEQAAIMFANSIGYKGLYDMSYYVFQDRNHLTSLIMRHGREIKKFEDIVSIEVKNSTRFLDAIFFVCPNITHLDLSKADLSFKDYANMACRLNKLRELHVDSSFGDKAMCLLAGSLSELESLNLSKAKKLSHKGIAYMRNNFTNLKKLFLPIDSIHFTFTRREQDFIEPLYGSLPLLNNFHAEQIHIKSTPSLALNFSNISILRLVNCNLADKDMLEINKAFLHLTELDISNNYPMGGQGVIAFVCAHDKTVKTNAQKSVKIPNLYEFCKLLKADYPNFVFEID